LAKKTKNFKQFKMEFKKTQNFSEDNVRQKTSSTLGVSNEPEIQTDELMVYNIMPKTKNSQIITPSLKIFEQEESPASNRGFFRKYLKFIIIGAVVVAAGIGIYLLINYLGKNSYKTEDLLVPQTNQGQEQNPEDKNIQTEISKEWKDKFFPNCTEEILCGEKADPDRDGLNNLAEFVLLTDPNNADSDQDGLADGDEQNIFGTYPLNSHSGKDSAYSDADYIKGGYNVKSDNKMTAEQISQISANMKTYGLHQPTIATLGDILNTLYKFSGDSQNSEQSTSTQTSSLDSQIFAGIDTSTEAKQDRDAQRSNTVKNLSISLIKYFDDLKNFPKTNSFTEMANAVKVYNKVGVNFTDPINKEPFVYTYSATQDLNDFTMSFYSETQNQQIKVRKTDAEKYKIKEASAINDDQRKINLEMLRTALLLYSQSNISGTQAYVFPTETDYKTALVPNFITTIPKDPKSAQDYEYKISETFSSFTLKAVFEDPPMGITGYLCNQEECRLY
jgi:hypothetical protein